MKSLKLTCAAVGLSLVALTPLMAESSLSVNVPYSFIAGKMKLPAGAYTIQEDAVTGVVLIRNSEGKTVALLSGPGVQVAGTGTPSVTFANVRGEMVLTSVQEAERPARVLPSKP